MSRGPRRKRTADEVVEDCRVEVTASQQLKAGQGSSQGRLKTLPIWPAAKLTALQVSSNWLED